MKIYNLEYWKTALKGVVPEELVTNEVAALREQQDKMLNLMAKKNADYGNAFNNGCDDLGMFYGLARIYDKAKRVITLTSNLANGKMLPNVVDETLYDTIQDLANYCNMILAWTNSQVKDVEMQTSSTGRLEPQEYHYIGSNLGVGSVVVNEKDKEVTTEIIEDYGIDNLYMDNKGYLYNRNKDDNYVAITDRQQNLVFVMSKTNYNNKHVNKKK